MILSWNGKAIRGNENPGHGCEKQGVQSRKVLCRITTGTTLCRFDPGTSIRRCTGRNYSSSSIPVSTPSGSFCMWSTHETLGSGTAPPCSPGTCGPRSSRTRRTSRPWRTPSNSSCLSRNGKAIRGNENPGHGCEKQGVQSRKVLCRITTGRKPWYVSRGCHDDDGGEEEEEEDAT